MGRELFLQMCLDNPLSIADELQTIRALKYLVIEYRVKMPLKSRIMKGRDSFRKHQKGSCQVGGEIS